MLSEETGSVGTSEQDFDSWFRASLSPYIVHASASLSVILIFVWTIHYRGPVSFSDSDVFNFHPLLQSTAFLLLIPESILLLRFSGFKHTTAKPFHAALHAVALILAILGIAAAYKYKRAQHGSHFQSLHSWLGLGTFLLLVTQWSFGAFLFYRARGSMRSKFAPVHIHIGHMIVFLASATVISGITERTIFAGTCSTLSRECAIANSAAIAALISCLALGMALTAVKRSGADRRQSLEPLLANDAPSEIA